MLITLSTIVVAINPNPMIDGRSSFLLHRNPHMKYAMTMNIIAFMNIAIVDIVLVNTFDMCFCPLWLCSDDNLYAAVLCGCSLWLLEI